MSLHVSRKTLAWSLAAILFAVSAPASAPLALGVAKTGAEAKAGKAAKQKKQVRPRHELAKEAGAYWDEVIAKRRVRIAKRRNGEPIALEDYVLTQPPLYIRPLPPRPPHERAIPRIPVLADFLRAAADAARLRAGAAGQRTGVQAGLRQGRARRRSDVGPSSTHLRLRDRRQRHLRRAGRASRTRPSGRGRSRRPSATTSFCPPTA